MKLYELRESVSDLVKTKAKDYAVEEAKKWPSGEQYYTGDLEMILEKSFLEGYVANNLFKKENDFIEVEE